MDQIDLLQRLLSLFPGPLEPLSAFVRVERELKKRLNLTRASLLTGRSKGFVDLAGAMSLPSTDPLFRRLTGSRKPILLNQPRREGWVGFWPLGAKNSNGVCWALGAKKGGKNFSMDEIKWVGLLTVLTASCFENRDLWKQLEGAGRQSSLGLMSAAMAHEIRNPLTALSTLIQLLPEKGKDAAFLESFQKLTLREIDRLTDLTRNFLDLAQPSPERTKKFELGPLLQQVGGLMGPLLQTKEVKLSIRPATDLFIKGNEHQIESLVLNLVQNAYRSIERGGRIRVSSRMVPHSKARGPGSWMEIRVMDDGRGIPPEELEKIFDPFFTTREGGTGLGLAICQKIAEFHGGNLKVKTVPQKGTIFSVFLPSWRG